MQMDERLNCLLPQYRRLRRLPRKKSRHMRRVYARRKQVWTGALIRNKIALLASSVAYAIQRMSRVVGCTIFLLQAAAGASRETDVGRKSIESINCMRLSVRSHCFTSCAQRENIALEVKTHLEVEHEVCLYLALYILRQQS